MVPENKYAKNIEYAMHEPEVRCLPLLEAASKAHTGESKTS